MTKTIQSKLNMLDNNRVIFITLAACVFFSFSTYIFFVGSALLSGVERQEISRQFELTGNSVHSLEVEYLTLRNSINDDYVKSQGFVAAVASKTKYISMAVSDTADVLTMNTR